jgi:hypothetical protein
VSLLKFGLPGEACSSEVAGFDAAKEFDAKEFVEVLEVHWASEFSANHIIWQGEDMAKILLPAIRIAGLRLRNGVLEGFVA